MASDSRGPLDRWWVRAAARSLLAAAPGGAALDARLRRRSPTPLDRDYALTKWRHVTAHLRVASGRHEQTKGRELRDQEALPTIDLTGSTVVELGTGWFPLVPLGLTLFGAEVVSIDTSAHLSADQIRAAARMLNSLIDDGDITVPPTDHIGVVADLGTATTPDRVHTLLRHLGVQTAVADAQDLSEVPATHGADLFVSNNTLEHIPEPVLVGILTEFRRVGSPTARMSHWIDMADHYAAVDPRIGLFNFLTIPDRRWALLNNRLHYQNRLRLPDHLRVHEHAGWQPELGRVQRREPEDLNRLRLVSPFDQMDPADLLPVRAHIWSTR